MTENENMNKIIDCNDLLIHKGLIIGNRYMFEGKLGNINTYFRANFEGILLNNGPSNKKYISFKLTRLEQIMRKGDEKLIIHKDEIWCIPEAFLYKIESLSNIIDKHKLCNNICLDDIFMEIDKYV